MHTYYSTELHIDELNEQQLREIVVNNKAVGIVKKRGTVYAFAAKCPHAGAPMCEGWLDASGKLVCPLHKYRFDPASGRNTSGEGYKLFTYPVQLHEGIIHIGIIG